MKRKACLRMMLVTGVLCATFTLAVSAQGADTNYFDLKVGGYFPQREPLSNGDAGLGTEFVFGHYFTKNIAAEFGVGYFQSNVPVRTVYPPVNYDATFRMYPVTLNLVVSNKWGRFEPFAKAGVGWYFADIDGAFDNETDSSFGYQFGAGILFGNFGIEGKYLSAKPSLLGTDVKLDGLTGTIFYRLRF
jgi:hypothetical protein